MEMSLAGKTALVTGGSRGIGRAISRIFAEAGAAVVVHYNRNKKAAEDTLSELKGGNHRILSGDLSSQDEIRKLAGKAVEITGRIDILVNNAGIYVEHPLQSTDFDKWEQGWNETIITNLFGPAHLCYFIGRHMIEKGGGRIINISSRGAFRGEPDAPAYGASKAGMNSMSQSLAKALAPHNIFVFVIAPGFVETDMVTGMLSGPQGAEIKNQSPLKRAATPDEVAGTALYLASNAPEYMTGCIIDINGASYLRS